MAAALYEKDPITINLLGNLDVPGLPNLASLPDRKLDPASSESLRESKSLFKILFHS